MSDVLLGDALGPRGRRRVNIIAAISLAAIVFLLYIAYGRLETNGQLEARKWEPFKEWTVWKFYLGGLWLTVQVAAVAMGFALVIGLLMALGRLSLNRPTRWITGIYVNVFRAIPLLLLMYYLYLALPRYDINISPYWAAVGALGIYNSAILGEIFRAGILSLPKGQTEAALSLGMSYWQAMLLVVVPQALRRMVPSIVGQLVTLLKDTSLAYVVTLQELLRRSRQNGEFFSNPLQSLFIAAVLYIIVNSLLGRLARYLEHRQRHRYNVSAIKATGVGEEVAVLSTPAH